MDKRIRYTKEELQEIKKQLSTKIKSTKPIKEILKEVGLSSYLAYTKPELYKIIKKRKSMSDIVRENKDKILDSLNQKLTIKQIAKELKIEPNILYNFIRKKSKKFIKN